MGWGVRLNEIAYGSGTDYRQQPKGFPTLVDDGPTIAWILQEGFKRCRHRYYADYFLSKLGAFGHRYETLKVARLPDWSAIGPQKQELPEEALLGLEELEAECLPSPMTNAQCETAIPMAHPIDCFNFRSQILQQRPPVPLMVAKQVPNT